MRFVDVPHMVRWMRQTGPQTLLAGMIEAMEKDFRRWDSFELRPRVASHSEIGVIELMPTSDGQTYAFKFVNVHPSNPARGYQTVTAFGVLADVHNGYPRLLAEMTLLTALRTAATSGMVTRLLARQDSRHLALIGAGSQSEFQVLANRAVRPIERVSVYDVDPAASQKLRRNLAAYDIEVEIADSASQAVAGADIITTCTADKRNAQVLSRHDIRPGVHLNAIGGDCPGKTELDPGILDMGPVFTEHTPQTRIEGGDPGQAGALPGHRAVGGAGRRSARAHERRAGHGLRRRRLRGRGLHGPGLPGGLPQAAGRRALLRGDRPRRRAQRPQGPVRDAELRYQGRRRGMLPGQPSTAHPHGGRTTPSRSARGAGA